MAEQTETFEAAGSPASDAADWLARWERQQASLVEGREARFDAMLDILAAHLSAPGDDRGRACRVLDLGC